MAEDCKNTVDVEKAAREIVAREKQTKLKAKQISKRIYIKICPLDA